MVCSSLEDSSNGHDQSWVVRLKPVVTGASPGSSTWVTDAQALGPPPTVSSGMEQPGHRPAQIWYSDHAQSGLTCYMHNGAGSNFAISEYKSEKELADKLFILFLWF